MTRIGSYAGRYGILLGLALLVVVAVVLNPRFLAAGNLANIAEQWAPIAVMAIAMTFALVGGGFDLSVGATYALSATLAASFAQAGSPVLGPVLALAAGCGFGLLNGLLITKARINPLIATLGVSQVIRGFALIYSDAETYTTDAEPMNTLGSGTVAGIPVPLIVVVVLAVLATVILSSSTFGRALYATGGNPQASYLSGIRVDGVKIWTYVLAGAAAALAGLMYVGRVGSGSATAGVGLELQVIAAALIGGISLLGGEGAVWRALAGVGVLAVLQNFFNQANVNAYWQSVIQGVIILLAVGIDARSRGGARSLLRRLLPDSRPPTTTEPTPTGAHR